MSRKILYLVTEDWFFASHFLLMARTAAAAGYETAIATRVRNHAAPLTSQGLRVIPWENERKSLGPFELLRSLFGIVAILRRERPDIVHVISLRMVILGGIAAKLAGVPALILAPTGLGHLWVANGLPVRIARGLTRFIVSHVLPGPRTRFVFENADDPKEFGLSPRDVILIGGAGVDPSQFAPTPPPPAPPLKVAVVARMTRPKGVKESVDAVLIARERGADIELHLYGGPDPSNPQSYSEAQLMEWARMPGIHWHGPTADVARVWRDNHIALLLSYREGLPKSLVEAAACARPIVATDVVGCREVARHGEEGLLVPSHDANAAAEALAALAADPALRQRFGAAARLRFEQRFTEQAVADTIGATYRTLTNGLATP